MLQSDRHAPGLTWFGSQPCSIVPRTETIVTRIYIRIMEDVSDAMGIEFQILRSLAKESTLSIIISWNGNIIHR